MTQSDFGTIDPTLKSGTALAGNLNDQRDAANSQHRGSTAPSYVTPGLPWLDDSASPIWRLKIFDGDTWLTLFEFDTSANTVVMPASANQLGGASANQYLRGDVAAFAQAFLETRLGVHGGHDPLLDLSGGNGGGGTDWGNAIWSLGKLNSGAGFGSSFLPGADMHGLVWLKADHVDAIAEVGEGLYVYQSGTVVAAFGDVGLHLPALVVDVAYQYESAETDIVLSGKANFHHSAISDATFSKMFYQIYLVCQESNLNYDPGQQLIAGMQDGNSASRGWAVMPWSSSLTTVTMPKSPPIIPPYLTNGPSSDINISKWKFKLRVFGW